MKQFEGSHQRLHQFKKESYEKEEGDKPEIEKQMKTFQVSEAARPGI
jgi:hypothetical protein